jgi:hypothetical protein
MPAIQTTRTHTTPTNTPAAGSGALRSVAAALALGLMLLVAYVALFTAASVILSRTAST